MAFNESDLRAASTAGLIDSTRLERADRFPAPPIGVRRPGRGAAAFRFRPPALVCGRTDRDDRDGTVFDSRVQPDGRPGTDLHGDRVRHRLRGGRSLSLARQELAHARRPPDRDRGLDGAARRLRRPGRPRPVGRVRQARHGAGFLRMDPGKLDFHGDRRDPRRRDRVALLSVPVHRGDHRRRALVHVDGPRALDRRQAACRLGDEPAGLALVRPRHARRRLDRRRRGGAATLRSGCTCSA